MSSPFEPDIPALWARCAARRVPRPLDPSVPLQGRQDARSPAAIRPGTRWWPTFPVSQPDQIQLPPRRSFEQHLGAVVGQARGITGQFPVPSVFTQKPGERLRTGIEDRHSKLAHPLRDSTGPTIRSAAPISIHRSRRFTAHPTLHLIAAHGRSLGALVSRVFPWTDGLPTSRVRAWLLPAGVERGLTQERGGPREGVYTRHRPAVVFAGRPDRPFADAARCSRRSRQGFLLRSEVTQPPHRKDEVHPAELARMYTLGMDTIAGAKMLQVKFGTAGAFQPGQTVLHNERRARIIRISAGTAAIRYWGEGDHVAV